MKLETHEINQLTAKTTKILIDPDTATSEDFIILYDTIYNFCAQPTPRFEILGAPVYTLLGTIVSQHCDNLCKFGSIETFNEVFLKYAHSTKILVNAYSYLQRYYIASALRKSNFIKELKNLFNYYFYKNYLDSSNDILESLIIMEMRKRSGCKINDLKTAITTYKNLLDACDEDKRYTAFKQKYLDDVQKRIDCKAPIQNAVSNVYKEIALILHVFDDASQSKLARQIADIMVSRVSEITEFIVLQLDRNKTFHPAFKIIDILGSSAVDVLQKSFEIYLDENLSESADFLTILSKFIVVSDRIRKDCYANKSVKKYMLKKFRSIILRLFSGRSSSVENAIKQAIGLIDCYFEYINDRLRANSNRSGTDSNINYEVTHNLLGLDNKYNANRVVYDVANQINNSVPFCNDVFDESIAFNQINNSIAVLDQNQPICHNNKNNCGNNQATNPIQNRNITIDNNQNNIAIANNIAIGNDQNNIAIDNDQNNIAIDNNQLVFNKDGATTVDKNNEYMLNQDRYNKWCVVNNVNSTLLNQINNVTVHLALTLMSYIPSYEPFLNALLLRIQERIIFSEYLVGKKLIKQLESIFSTDDLYKIKKCINDSVFSATMSTTSYAAAQINSGSDNFKILPKILTKGFWTLSEGKCELHHKFKNFEQTIQEKIRKKSSRAVVDFLAHLSPVELEFCGYEIKMSADCASILLFIEENDDLTIQTLKSLCKDSNFESNLQTLLDNNIIMSFNGKLSLNNLYNSGNIDILKGISVSKVESVVNQDSTDGTQSVIMKIMKEKKEMDYQQVKFIMKDHCDVDKCLDSLVENGYLCRNVNLFRYIP